MYELLHVLICGRPETLVCMPMIKTKQSLLPSVVSDPCPDSHPYPLDAGNKCCARWFRTSDISQFIDLYDDASECPANLRIDCPDLENKCKQNTPFFTGEDVLLSVIFCSFH